MPDFDWTQFNSENNGHTHASHSEEEHNRAHVSQYEPVFQMAFARFEENFAEFTKHYDDKDPHARENFMHLFEAAVVHAINHGVEAAMKQDKQFDEVASVYAAAGFGYILGRTFQEFEVKHLLKNNDFAVIGQTVTTEKGSSEI